MFQLEENCRNNYNPTQEQYFYEYEDKEIMNKYTLSSHGSCELVENSNDLYLISGTSCIYDTENYFEAVDNGGTGTNTACKTGTKYVFIKS